MVGGSLVRLRDAVDAVPGEGPVVAQGVGLPDDAVEAVEVERRGAAEGVDLDALALLVPVLRLAAPALAAQRRGGERLPARPAEVVVGEDLLDPPAVLLARLQALAVVGGDGRLPRRVDDLDQPAEAVVAVPGGVVVRVRDGLLVAEAVVASCG